ncbi:MAG: sulfatase-like hydrolase/transferase, partial [Saprospiraceae bacterium]|nr:sulfatase-like hydrolase/transferase [Saprospiraceae bacterium]
GFSDLGAFGGEIRTPNLDKLAGQGVRFTDFYVGATCSPTRAMLMTGMDNHRVGLGNMYEQTAPNQLGRIGYTGVLSTQVPTIAERLRGNGYHTYMAGKWHLGHAPDHIPHARGFERDFTLINAAGSHFDMTGSAFENEVSEFTEDGKYINKLPPNYYSTRTYTEKMV